MAVLLVVLARMRWLRPMEVLTALGRILRSRRVIRKLVPWTVRGMPGLSGLPVPPLAVVARRLGTCRLLSLCLLLADRLVLVRRMRRSQVESRALVTRLRARPVILNPAVSLPPSSLASHRRSRRLYVECLVCLGSMFRSVWRWFTDPHSHFESCGQWWS